MRRRDARLLPLSSAVLLLLLPAAARGISSSFEATAPPGPVYETTLEIFHAGEPERVVERRTVTGRGGFTVDLEAGKDFGVRVAGGPVLVPRFRAGDPVKVALVPPVGLSLAVGAGGFGQWGDATASSSFTSGSGEGEFASADFSLDGELMFGPCGCFPGSPRPFLHAGSRFLVDSKSDFVEAGQFGMTGLLELEAESRANLYAGLGAAFPVAWRGRDLLLKGSLNYVPELVTIRGVINEQAFISSAFFREQKREVFHGVGIELAGEAPLFRYGAVGVNAYASAAVNFYPGDQAESVRVSGVGGNADFRFEKDLVSARGGVGLRFGWLGPVCGACDREERAASAR